MPPDNADEIALLYLFLLVVLLEEIYETSDGLAAAATEHGG